jgi:lipid-A-disaccharide synthase-like uncharacterized protein
MGALIEKKRKTIRAGVGSRFLNCWTLIKKTNESPVPIDFLSFYTQYLCIKKTNGSPVPVVFFCLFKFKHPVTHYSPLNY